MVWEGMQSAGSLGLGALLIALGIWPILNMLGVVGPLPEIVAAWVPTLLPWLFLIGGIYLLVDAFGEWGGWYCWASVLIGISVLIIGALLLLYQFGLIGFLLPIPPIVYSVLFILEGIFLIIGSFMQL